MGNVEETKARSPKIARMEPPSQHEMRQALVRTAWLAREEASEAHRSIEHARAVAAAMTSASMRVALGRQEAVASLVRGVGAMVVTLGNQDPTVPNERFVACANAHSRASAAAGVAAAHGRMFLLLMASGKPEEIAKNAGIWAKAAERSTKEVHRLLAEVVETLPDAAGVSEE